MFVILKVGIILAVVHHATAEDGIEQNHKKTTFGVFTKISKCAEQGGLIGIANCIAVRTLKTLAKTSQEKVLQISPSIQLIADSEITSRTAKTLSAFKETGLPQDPLEQASKLFDNILETASALLSGRTLKIKLPELGRMQYGRALEEGRGKIKKIVGPLMMGIGSNMLTVIPILLGGLALLSAKALIVGKLALAISAILVIQYILSHRPSDPSPYYPYSGFNGLNTGGYPSYGSNIPSWSNSQYPYARSFDVSDGKIGEATLDKQLAYSGH